MANAKLVSRLSYETSFTRAEIEQMLATQIRKSGLGADFDHEHPHFKWTDAGCTTSFIGERETAPPRAEHADEKVEAYEAQPR